MRSAEIEYELKRKESGGDRGKARRGRGWGDVTPDRYSLILLLRVRRHGNPPAMAHARLLPLTCNADTRTRS